MIMIKKYALNKITVTSMCLFLLLMFYILPTTSDNINTTILEEDKNKEKTIVYLLDEDNFVSKVTTFYTKNTIEDEIKYKINILTNGLAIYDNFYSLIPKNTKLNSVKVDKNNVYLDFSKEILEVSEYFEEEMIESIVYTLTQINGLDNIYITVDGKSLDSLPNSKKILSYPLTRNIGINKEYDIDSFNNINKTTVIFQKKNNDKVYYVPVTKVTNSSDDKINIIIEELKSGINSQNNLNGLVNEKVVLEDYNIEEDKVNLVFNEYIFNDNNVILEEVKYTIAESIFENYNIKEVIFNTKEEKNIDNVVKNTKK